VLPLSEVKQMNANEVMAGLWTKWRRTMLGIDVVECEMTDENKEKIRGDAYSSHSEGMYWIT
jgi:hypothetical protein